MIYHICTAQQWEAAQLQGYFEAPSLHTEGFIHCSTMHQVAGVLQRYYAGVPHLVQLSIDESALTSVLQYEWAESVHQDFPHVYGVIDLAAVVKVTAV